LPWCRYHTLLVRESVPESSNFMIWTIHFGDYDRSVVEQEREESERDMGKTPGDLVAKMDMARRIVIFQ
jgi:hypothetical protein